MRKLLPLETEARPEVEEGEEEDEDKYSENSKLLRQTPQLSRSSWLSATQHTRLKHLAVGLLVFWTLVEGLGLARQATANIGPPVLVVVYSAPANLNRRMALRDTWCSPASLLPSRSSCLFLLGSTGNNTKAAAFLRQEQDLFGDLVLNDSFVESYRNLSRKALVLLALADTLRSPDQLCVFKGDDDIYVNINALSNVCGRAQQLPPALTGRVFLGSHNRVHRTGKNALTPDEFPLAHFEPYPVGPLVLLPLNTAYKLWLASQHLRLLTGPEDVLIAYLAYYAGVAVRADQQLYALRDQKQPTRKICVGADT